MLRIAPDEYRSRVEALQAAIMHAGLDVFIVSAFDSIYYLTGAGFEPLERPFFLLVRPRGAMTLIVPKLDHAHMKKAHGVLPENIRTWPLGFPLRHSHHTDCLRRAPLFVPPDAS